MRSTRASLRALNAYALDNPTSDGAVQTITRTLKLKVDAPEGSDLQAALNKELSGYEAIRRNALAELEKFWEKKPDEFIKMVKASAKSPYEDKTSCYGWILTKYVTGREFSQELSYSLIRSVFNGIAGSIKSFITRRANVAEDIDSIVKANAKLWASVIPKICKELEIADHPPAPPEIDAHNLTDKAVLQYNQWVAQSALWHNLILVQKHSVRKSDVPTPRRIKGYPGFPGSVKFKAAISLDDAVEKLVSVTQSICKDNLERFENLDEGDWALIVERFPAPPAEFDKPKSAKLKLGKRLAALIKAHPDWEPHQIAKEILEGQERAATKLLTHLKDRGYNDRQALIKLCGLLTMTSVFAEEPVRVKGDYVLLGQIDWPRLVAYGEVRGAMHSAGDESAAIEISGFSVSAGSNTFSYDGAIAYLSEDSQERWFFALNNAKGLKGVLGPETLSQSKRVLTPLIGFGITGGSRKKDLAKPKQIVRDRLWVDKEHQPLFLPLQFGKRIGREYFWHMDHPLAKDDHWIPANARIIRQMPPDRSDLAQFFVAITFQMEAPPPAEPPAGKYIGVDRGEATPAAYAVVDEKGKLLETGKIAEDYREQQRKYEALRREFQRTKGGYNRWLKAKESNRAKSLGGEVGRGLLDLMAEHQAPVVLERLNSALVTRGGKGTAMSYMQYERMISTLEQKLAQVGCCSIPSQPKFRKNDNHFIKLVNPAYTSQTCSACGTVHDSGFYKDLTLTLELTEKGGSVKLPSGKSLSLPESYESVNWRLRTKKTVQTREKLDEILKGDEVKALPVSRFNKLLNLLRYQLLNFRPKQDHFICLECGHEADADEQAALNIARKFIFLKGQPAKAGDESSEKKRQEARDKWKQWYPKQIAKGWK